MTTVNELYAKLRGQYIEQRQTMGISIPTLASTVGMSYQIIYAFEGGFSRPTVPTLFALASGLRSEFYADLRPKAPPKMCPGLEERWIHGSHLWTDAQHLEYRCSGYREV